MSVSFAQIETEFERLRDFLLNDVERILGLEPGVNYAAAAVIACGFEALANVRDGKSHAGEGPFAETLPREWRPVAGSLFNVLRNGIVHGYETQRLVAKGQTVEVAIAWRQGEHLMWDAGRLVLNVRAMADGLRDRFADYENLLHDDAAARDRFLRRGKRDRERHVRGYEAEAWAHLLRNRSGSAQQSP